jgi:transposase
MKMLLSRARAGEALKRDVGAVFIGFPWNIARDRPGKGNVSMWGQRKLLLRLATTLENAGIAAFAVSEDYTSKECALHNVELLRRPRGLVHCPHRHVMHADINAALNILKRGLKALGIKAGLPSTITTKSFIPKPSGVKPITPR